MTDSPTQTKRYSKYTRQMRLKLIKFVDEDKLSTAHAARILGIKQTSACRIMRSYHKFNRIFEKKADRLHRQRQYSQISPQKDEDFQNIKLQQKRIEMDKRKNQSLLNLPQSTGEGQLAINWGQNMLKNSLSVGNQGLSMVFHPIFSMNNQCFPLYYQNMYALPFNFYL